MDDNGVREIQRSLDRLQARLVEAAGAAADEIADTLESYSKANAPFRDRTGNLRGSIDGTWAYEPTGYKPDLARVILAAGMEYGVFVELCRSGKYAFLWPALVANQGTILAIWRRHLRSTFQGFGL